MTPSAPDAAPFPDAPQVFHERFDELAAVAYRVAFRVLGDRDEAEDIAQEALARVLVRWERVASYAEAYTARTATNLAISRWRRRRRRAQIAERRVLVSDDGPWSPGAPDGAAVRAELVTHLRRLPRRQREVVVLRYLADLPEAEVAAALGCSPGSVKRHAHRGLAALRIALTAPDTVTPTTPEALP